jgi:hypothetical protein
VSVKPSEWGIEIAAFDPNKSNQIRQDDNRNERNCLPKTCKNFHKKWEKNYMEDQPEGHLVIWSFAKIFPI